MHITSKSSASRTIESSSSFKRKPCVGMFDLASYCLEENLTLQETEEQENKIHCKSFKGLNPCTRMIAFDLPFSIEVRQQSVNHPDSTEKCYQITVTYFGLGMIKLSVNG